jgi:hypothetical protein
MVTDLSDISKKNFLSYPSTWIGLFFVCLSQIVASYSTISNLYRDVELIDEVPKFCTKP